MGGMFGESKFDVLNMIPARFVPATVLIHPFTSVGSTLSAMQKIGLQFPVIAKPDIGERGLNVRRLNNSNELEQYLATHPFDFLLQEFIEGPLEFGVFYVRYPDQQHGHVTSIVAKEMLCVTGDGAASLGELILRHERAKLQWKKLQRIFHQRLGEVIPKDQRIELVSIGNHCLGTKFLDGSNLITPALSELFDNISRQIPGFYFGRYDIRCQSIEALYAGDISVMELNGCGAEPAHIYQPGYSLFKALGVLFRHWQTIFDIARQNKKNGVAYTPFTEAIAHYRRFKKSTEIIC